MKDTRVHFANGDVRVEIIDSPVPRPSAEQVLIKVVVAGTNPKDYKLHFIPNYQPQNAGDDIAGIVHEVGAEVTDFRVGDRVMAFHTVATAYGAHAEYAIASSWTTAIVPEKVSFEEAATIPLAGYTAALSLFRNLLLPEPWAPAKTPIPFLVYGGSSAVGAFTIKLARAANIHPIIAVAGKGAEYVETLLDKSKGDVVLDYRVGEAQLQKDIQVFLSKSGSGELRFALDAISTGGTFQLVADTLPPGGKIAFLLPFPDDFKAGEGVETELTMVGDVHGLYGDKSGWKDFGYIWAKAFTRGLEAGWFSGHPYQVVDGGLAGLQGALDDLKAGKVSASKYVLRIAETEGVISR